MISAPPKRRPGAFANGDAIDGVTWLINRFYSDVKEGGTTGTLGNYVQVALDQMGGQTSRMKDPRNSPLTGLLDPMKNYFSAMVQEHTLIPSRKVIDQFRQTISGYRNLRSTGFDAANLLGLPIPDAKAFKGGNELRWVRQREQMFQDSDPVWQASHTRGSGGGFNAPKRNELSQFKDRIAAGPISGDVEGTKAAMSDYLAKFPHAKAKKSALAALKSSYQISQPLKIGNSSGADSQQALMKWAKAHLPPEEVERMKQLSRTYIETANRAGLKLKEPKADDSLILIALNNRDDCKRVYQRRIGRDFHIPNSVRFYARLKLDSGIRSMRIR